jgi:glycosyltransferase involved in cell wall biosynthesis
MKIAIFDHLITDSNAIGKCHLELLTHLADDHEFTVFAVEFDNPRPDRIEFVRVPALRRPLLGLMISFHIVAPLILWWHQRFKKRHFDIVQGIGGNFLKADLAYGHFCHRVYLTEHTDARPTEPVRRLYSWLYDSIVSLLEPYSYGNASYIVTPSEGLARELTSQFSDVTTSKTHVISNPIDLTDLYRPPDLDTMALREELGFYEDDLVMIFIAAGHFERKGLPVLLNAMQLVDDSRVRLLVIGGRPYMIDEYKKIVRHKQLDSQVTFAGYQNNIRPYLWASDLFVFPSSYETFSLVTFEAAGAGLPLLVAPLHGVEELIRDGHNGWQVERTPEAFAERIQYALQNPQLLRLMGHNAADSVKHYSLEAFGENWKAFYNEVAQKQHPDNSVPGSSLHSIADCT